jgi:hypothetical protein
MRKEKRFIELLIHVSSPGYDVVIPACPESFFQKDSRQAGVTEKETYCTMQESIVIQKG